MHQPLFSTDTCSKGRPLARGIRNKHPGPRRRTEARTDGTPVNTDLKVLEQPLTL